MQARLGADFSTVRVHTDAAAQQSAAELGARAYTSGEHVVIGDGGGDRHTLAHELTHVIQQRSGPVAGTVQKDRLAVSDPNDAFERAAEANARRAMSGAAPEVQPQSAEQVRSATPAVQRMPLAQFQQHLAANQQVANDPDFITFFEIRRGRLDPEAVVNHPDAGSQQRLRRLVENDKVNTNYVNNMITLYRGIAKDVEGARPQPKTLANPNIAGLEIELADVVLNVPDDAVVRNGLPLAETEVTPVYPVTEAGPAVMRLEIEGMDRLNGKDRKTKRQANVEIVYGPLATEDYTDDNLIQARKKLHAVLRGPTGRGQTLKDLIDGYNNSLKGAENRYKMVPTELSKKLTKGRATTTGTAMQTNVSTPYTKLSTEVDGPGDFSEFFTEEEDAPMFNEARKVAKKVAVGIDNNWINRHEDAGGLRVGDEMKSLLTHVLYQEAKYIKHRARTRRDRLRPEDKHLFHVMLKLSPQDVVMSILSDSDAKLLLAWLVDKGADTLAHAVKATFKVTGSHAVPMDTEGATAIHKSLVDVLVARLLAGQQLLSDLTDRQSSVYSNDNRRVGAVTHVHPRPDNRRPITINNSRYYMVVEQRTKSHPLNKDIDSAQSHATQIGNLQRP
jgi:hypothetical protein